MSAVVNRPILGRGVTLTFTLNPRALAFRPRTKTSFDVHYPRMVSSVLQLLPMENFDDTACKVTPTCCDAFYCDVDGYHQPRPPDKLVDGDVRFHHPPRPPDFYSESGRRR